MGHLSLHVKQRNLGSQSCCQLQRSDTVDLLPILFIGGKAAGTKTSIPACQLVECVPRDSAAAKDIFYPEVKRYLPGIRFVFGTKITSVHLCSFFVEP